MKRALALVAALFAADAARACDVALVLAIDVSGSVDAAEYRLQMDGLAAALADPTVRDALTGAEAAVAVTQWTGASRQIVSVPWRRMATDADIDVLKAEVEAVTREWRHYSTAIGDALAAAAALIGELDAPCKRRVVDVSGDGKSNEGRDVSQMRDALARGGITVNGLAIETDDDDLTAYYRANVIGGPGAFVATAKGFADYPRAIRRKLLRELTDKVVSTD